MKRALDPFASYPRDVGFDRRNRDKWGLYRGELRVAIRRQRKQSRRALRRILAEEL